MTRRPISHLEAMRIARAHREAPIVADKERWRIRASRLAAELGEANAQIDRLSKITVGDLGQIVKAEVRESAREHVKDMVLLAVRQSTKMDTGDTISIQFSYDELRFCVPNTLTDHAINTLAREIDRKAFARIAEVYGKGEFRVSIRIPEIGFQFPVRAAA